MQYPEHDKMSKVQTEAQILGEFLENLPSLKLTLCDSESDHTSGRLFPSGRSIQGIIAEHLGIDLRKIDAEKQQMLETIRRNNAEDRELGR